MYNELFMRVIGEYIIYACVKRSVTNLLHGKAAEHS